LFSSLTAVHCADALSQPPATESPDSAPFDEAYLAALGLSGKISEWRCFVDEFRLAPE
jgi:hypothetical protein